MRHVKNILLVVFTLLLVAAGAFMPIAASVLEDAYGANKSDTWIFDSFSLTLKQKTDLSRTLRVLNSGNYYMNEAYKSDDAVLTEGLALEAAENLLMKLVEYGLLSKEELTLLSDPRVMAQVIIPLTLEPEEDWESMGDAPPAAVENALISGQVEEGDAIPTWRVVWNTPDYYYIWLDDASGKAVHISAFLPQPDEDPDVMEQVEKLMLFLTDYYGADAEISEPEWFDGGIKFLVTLPLEDEQFILSLELFFDEPDWYVTLYPWES